MREIKFRGKRIDNGEWVYGYILTNNLGTYIVTEKNPHECTQYGYIEINEYYRVDPQTVGQFTGLCDKNGKEIYEGDIIDLSCEYEPDRKGVVEFADGSFICRSIKRKWDKALLSDVLKAYEGAIVLGNIYENSELLETNSNK